jgi:hypothetical protein
VREANVGLFSSPLFFFLPPPPPPVRRPLLEMLGQLHWVHRYFPPVYCFYRGLTFHLCHAGEIEDNTSAPGWRGELPEEEEGLLREVRRRQRDEEALSALYSTVQS